MCELFNRKLSDDAVAFWMEELTPAYGPHLFEALRLACRETWMPSVGWVLSTAERLERQERERQRDEDRERRKREYEAAIEQRKRQWDALSQEERDRYNAAFDAMRAELKRAYSGASMLSWLDSDPNRGIGSYRHIAHYSYPDEDLPF
jgi:hypothetical protein